MRIFLTGATGVIGSRLVSELKEEGHTVVVYGRSQTKAQDILGNDIEFVPLFCDSSCLQNIFENVDGVINLAGESLFTGRWNREKKHRLVESRVILTSSLVQMMEICQPKPKFFISASAVGYYGNRGDEILTEDSTPGSDFLARLCQDWEASAWRASDLGIRVAMLRFGIVLDKSGGALSQMLPIFKAGLGGKLGKGNQYMPWIKLDDLLGIIKETINDSKYKGPLNAVAPEQITNKQFTRALGKALGRPTVMSVPSFALKAAIGEAATVLLSGQRVEPKRLKELGYQFRFPEIEGAMNAQF